MSQTGQDTIYQMVADQLLEKMEEGTAPWDQPWSTAGAQLLAQRNAFTNRPYTGSNIFGLFLAGRTDPRWATFKSIIKAGGKVKKGTKQQVVVFWKFLETTDKDNPEKIKTIPLLRYYRVVNIEDTENLNLPPNELPTPGPEFDPIAAAERIANGYPKGPAVLPDGGTRAYYRPGDDSIHLPRRAEFKDAQGYYATLMHELAHSTGHESRLDRLEGCGPFGSHGYGREELIAEFGSAFLCAMAGIDNNIERPAAYLDNWRRAIKADIRSVVVAAGKAQKAANYILGN